MTLRLWKPAALLAAACPIPMLAYSLDAHAQPPPPSSTSASSDLAKGRGASAEIIGKIREEGLKRSKVMETLEYLTDVIGPRLTGSPQLKRANEWTRDRMVKFGLENGALEAWGPFGRGWSLKRFSAQVIEPQAFPLIAYPKAWSPGTGGPLVGEVVHLDVKTDADFAKYKGKLKGAIVLLSQPVEVAAHFEPQAARKTDKELLDLADALPPQPRGFGGGGRRAFGGGPNAATKDQPPAKDAPKEKDEPKAKEKDAEKAVTKGDGPADMTRMMADMRARLEVMRKRSQFVADEGAAAVIDVSNLGDGGTLFVAQASVPSSNPFPAPGERGRRVSAWDKDAPKILPQITMAKEHYNRLVRMLKAGEKVKMALDLDVQFHDDDLMAYNTVAEIPGTDLKDEVVMLGGHLDSWHSGTGATDNASGCAVVMEAARIIKALDLKPRRTIRVALWSGEEQGLLGSRAYVSQHFGRNGSGFMFGAPEPQKTATPDSAQNAAFEKFSAYYNLDNGTGKIRGIYLQGNEAARGIFRGWLAPFKDLGAQTITVSNTGGTDHQSFDGIGLPGFQFIQDEVEYETRTHHSNMDMFDRIQADDMKQAAVIMAAFAYNTAMMDERIPRKPATNGNFGRPGPAAGKAADASKPADAPKAGGDE